jgi:hypothetical protein
VIEPLESRIAPAVILPYADGDGDAVIITLSKGTQRKMPGMNGIALATLLESLIEKCPATLPR